MKNRPARSTATARPRSSESTGRTAVRCAIYTRKSTEEGLEQEFNSLDAQREAAEAFIASQREEGWTAIPTRYDDGGFSGGTMERPALVQLLADIEAGAIDCLVVYKVDRLSRSLLDFAQIIKVLDSHNVAFVSVTQQFNTATSLGRLILHILLSFAQFEREMISERTRDKMSAARRKGKWVGGMPILGYDVAPEGGRLIVNEEEAERVRQIFGLFLKTGSVMQTVTELNHRGWTLKSWTTKTGVHRPGRPFDKSALLGLLRQVAYLGKVNHKGEILPGEHPAVVADEIFTAVDKRLTRNQSRGGADLRNRHGSLLRGIISCGPCSRAMVHTNSRRGNRIYRYYVCTGSQKRGRGSCPARSVPAAELERAIADRLRAIGQDPRLVESTLAAAEFEGRTRIASLQHERKELERQISNFGSEVRKLVGTSSNRAETKEAIASALAEVQARAEVAERRLREVRREIAGIEGDELSGDDIRQALGCFTPVWEKLTAHEQQQALRLMIQRVTYDGAKGTIELTFRPNGLRALIEEATSAQEATA